MKKIWTKKIIGYTYWFLSFGIGILVMDKAFCLNKVPAGCSVMLENTFLFWLAISILYFGFKKIYGTTPEEKEKSKQKGFLAGVPPVVAVLLVTIFVAAVWYMQSLLMSA